MLDKIIKLKFKQLTYQYLKKSYEKNLSKLPTNCKYNKAIKLPNKSIINICSFNFEENFEVDLCYKREHSEPCNAFCPRRTKEELFVDFMNDLKDEQIRATSYKDINILFWLYPELKIEDFTKESNWFVKLWKKLKSPKS